MALPSSAHDEYKFETDIVTALLETGWTQGDPSAYHRLSATYPTEFWAFLAETQAQTLAELERQGLNPIDLASRVRRAIEAVGFSRALVHGVHIGDVPLKLMFARPTHGLNAEVERCWRANRLMVVRQLEYSARNGNCLDLCLFLNGLPIITAEVKSEFTQTVQRAIEQYQTDRLPQGEPLLTPGTGALVHFAFDQSQAYMTTALAGRQTPFLPFNRFSEAGEVNPRVLKEDGTPDYPTCHVWRSAWNPSVLLNILAYYVTQEPRDDKTERPDDRVLFPRLHQWEACETLVADISANGPGRRYLIQHSPGSGKSNTIGWTAHALSDLHDAAHQKVFSSVLLLTDRIVLDQQTRETASLLARFASTAKHAESTSQLVQLLTTGCPVVVSTIQKFAHVLKRVQEDPDMSSKWAALSTKNFAVLIDEAHSSQQGEYHAALKRHLETYRGGNVTYLAFTATPKDETLAIFGTEDEHGLKQPFHIYSMYQALHENFILDVLANYYPVQGAYCLVVNGQDALVQASQAERMRLTSVGQDPTAIREKVRIIASHFHEHVASSLNGRAKAMVVTSSRLAAFRYHRALQQALCEKGLAYGCLVAFSDAVYEPEEERKYTESQANGLPEHTDVALAFRADDQRILIVADKYQTGFNQPLLNAMYLDKVLSGDITAVQTLSRLNRLYPGKSTPFILDFVNNEEDVRTAFEKYLGKVELTRYEGMPALEKLCEVLMSFKVFDEALIDDICTEIAYRGQANQARLKDLHRVIDNAVQALDVAYQQQFSAGVTKYIAQYDIASKVDYRPSEQLHRLYSVCRLIKRHQAARSAKGIGQEPLSVLMAELAMGDKIVFEAVNPEPFRTSLDGQVELISRQEHEGILLSQFVREVNALSLHGDTAALCQLLERIIEDLSKESRLTEEAQSNSFDSFQKASMADRFRRQLGRFAMTGTDDEKRQARALQGTTRAAKELRERAYRATARCIYNRAIF